MADEPSGAPWSDELDELDEPDEDAAGAAEAPEDAPPPNSTTCPSGSRQPSVTVTI